MLRNGSPVRFSGTFALLAYALTAVLASSGVASAQTPTFNALVQTPVTVGSGFPNDATVGDINGDGKLDAIIPGINGLRILLGNGDGTFVDQVSPMADVTSSNVTNLPAHLASFLPRSVGGIGGLGGGIKTVDVNQDGKLDLVSVTTTGINFFNYNFVTVLINTGNDANGVPQFTTTHNWVSFAGVRPLTVGDLNGDSMPDFIIGNCCNGLQIWMNNSGNGSLTPGQLFNLTPGSGNPAVGQGVITDLNGDGRADFVVSSEQNGGANIMFGNGNGTLQTPGAYLPNGGASVAVADLNGDSRPDLLMGNKALNQEGLLVYLNNGGGTFTASALYAIPGFSSSWSGGASVAAADFNGDGKLDAVLTNTNSNRIEILVGDGTGGFGAPISYAAATLPTFEFVGDFTGDGKSDIGVVLLNSRSFGVLTNKTVFAQPLPTQTLTILGGVGNPGDVAANVEYFNPSTGQWQLAYLADYAQYGHPVTHPWGNVPGTNRWVNYRTDGASDSGASGSNVKWYDYRVRFTVPADAISPKMTLSIKVDNFANVAINGVSTGPTLVGQPAPQNVDAAFSQAVHPGENTVTIRVGDAGSLNGFNFKIELSMQSAEPIEIVEVSPDATAPAITSPGDIIAEATSAAGAVVSFTTSATDDVDGAVAVTANPDSGSTFAIGNTTVNLTASDAAGNDATASFTVTVQDTIAPVVTAGADIVTEATSPDGAAVSYPDADATDAVGVVSSSSNPPSGSTFPLGSTTVVATAKDAAGNTGADSFTVTVVDTTDPELTVPANQTLEAANADGAVATFAASATDIAGAVSLAYSHASGSTFQIGTTTVKVTATDGSGNDTEGSFTITVKDTIAPALAIPANQVLEATSASGAVATYAATATDAVGVTALTHSPVSGSTFAIGTSTVTVSASDAAGNTSGGSFTIKVQDTTAPSVSALAPSTGSLWPPNHQMVSVGLSIGSSDIVGVAGYNVTITSSEPDNGLGDGDTAGDFQVIGNGTMTPSVKLRSERAGGGNGRTYTITVVAKDAAGNTSAPRTTTVSVPKSQGKK
jgi:hypothetical protein